MGTPECAPHAPRGGDGAGRMTGGGGATNVGTPRRFAPAPHSLPVFPLGWPRRWRLAFGGRSRARAGPRKRAHATCFRRSGRTAQRCPGDDKGPSGRTVRPARRPPARPEAAGAVRRRSGRSRRPAPSPRRDAGSYGRDPVDTKDGAASPAGRGRDSRSLRRRSARRLPAGANPRRSDDRAGGRGPGAQGWRQFRLSSRRRHWPPGGPGRAGLPAGRRP